MLKISFILGICLLLFGLTIITLLVDSSPKRDYDFNTSYSYVTNIDSKDKIIKLDRNKFNYKKKHRKGYNIENSFNTSSLTLEKKSSWGRICHDKPIINTSIEEKLLGGRKVINKWSLTSKLSNHPALNHPVLNVNNNEEAIQNNSGLLAYSEPNSNPNQGNIEKSPNWSTDEDFPPEEAPVGEGVVCFLIMISLYFVTKVRKDYLKETHLLK